MSQQGMRTFALAPGEGTSVENPTGGVTTFKAISEQTAGGLTAIEGVSAPGEGPPLHVHGEQDEFIYTLDGTFRVRLGDDVVEDLRIGSASDVLVLVVLNPGSSLADTTANLAAPLLVNPGARLAGQIVLDEPGLPVSAPLLG